MAAIGLIVARVASIRGFSMSDASGAYRRVVAPTFWKKPVLAGTVLLGEGKIT
jgi:hypothetical protein